MEHIDNFLNKLKTDRNTFLTYVLTLISLYLCIDRFFEIVFIGATGMYVDLWGPIKYTFAILCATFAYHFSSSSKFATNDRIKLSFLYIYYLALYIIGISMLIQWVNFLSWLAFFCVPNYSDIIANFRELIKPAFSALAWYVPISTAYNYFMNIYLTIQDRKDARDSVFDYGGIDLSDKNKDRGPYTCEMLICKDGETGQAIKISETRRFESTLVVGVSGSGKTSMIFEPMVARDIEKKHFYKEASKELGYTALRTGLANLNSPYSNEYINDNFSLNMLVPIEAKMKLYKAFMSKLILSNKDDNLVYKNLGVTYIAPDFETVENMKDVAKAYGVKYKIIDPTDPNSEGLNPFALKDPIKISIAISSVMKVMFQDDTELTSHTTTDTFLQNLAAQAIENLTLLLCETYPLEHDDELPTLEELLKLLYDFKEIQRLAELMASIPKLAEKYQIQLQYYKSTFFEDAPNKEETQKQIQTLTAQLANLIRYPGIKNVICNKSKNINYDESLKNGEVIFICTRRGDLGSSVHKAFGTFILLLMQHSILSRPGTEKSRIPHFLYIDEFPPFLSKNTASIFTLYRKYRVGTTISAQNLSQFGTKDGANYRQTIMANCCTKIVFGNNTPEDNDWWEKEMGDKREWQFTREYQATALLDNSETLDNAIKNGAVNGPDYTGSLKNPKYAWVKNYAAGKIQALKFKQIIYKTKDIKGKNLVGKAKVDFLDESYKKEQKFKTYHFSKFSRGKHIDEEESEPKKKFNLKNIRFDGTAYNPNDTDPIQNNNTNVKYEFDNEDPIKNMKDLKKNNNDNK